MIYPAKALSVRQPWAWLIVNGFKDIENRDWTTRFRGHVLIHASTGMTGEEYEDCVSMCHDVSKTRPFPAGTRMPGFNELKRGGIVGMVDIFGCVPEHPSPWFVGKYGFELRDAKPLLFMPMRGQLGFFDAEYVAP